LHICFAQIEKGYIEGTWPPGIESVSEALVVAHNMLLAHSQIYRLYESEYKYDCLLVPDDQPNLRRLFSTFDGAKPSVPLVS